MTRKGLCLDATGTLIETRDPVGEVYRRAALAWGIDVPAQQLEDAFRQTLRDAPARGTEGHSAPERRRLEFEWWEERIRETFRASDDTVRFDDFPGFARTLFEDYRNPDHWRVRPAAPRVLRELRQAGVRMCIVSNFDYRLPEILEGLELSHFFESIILPSDHGFRKPERGIFEAAGRALESPLDHLVYIGDDSPARLEEIRAHGLGVLDVREGPGLAALPDLLTLPATLCRP